MEFKHNAKSQGEIEAFPNAEKHYLFHFQIEVKYETILLEGPWIFSDQSLNFSIIKMQLNQ